MNLVIKSILVLVIFHLAIPLVFAGQRLCFEFHGAQQELLANIQARLDLSDEKNCLNYASIAEAKKAYAQATIEIKKAIEPFGYFKPIIYSNLTNINQVWLATFNINPGPPTLISNIDIKIEGPGQNNPRIIKAVQHFKLKTNEIFNLINYNNAKNKLFKVAQNQGYIKASFKNSIIVNPRNSSAKVNIILQTGDRYFFGRVFFKKGFYPQSFLHRMLNFHQGDFFSSKKLVALQQSMEQSYFFSQTNIIPDFEHIEDYEVPVHIDYDLAKSRRYTAGGGYGTLTGPRLSATMSSRHLTPNGDHFEGDLKLSSILADLTATYYIPGQNPLSDEWLMALNLKKFSPKDNDSHSVTVTGGYSTKKNNTEINASLNYLIDRFSINGGPGRKSHELYPSLKIIYLKARNLMNPHKGLLLSLQLKGASQYIISTTSFLQTQAHAKAIFTPLSFARIVLRGDLGYTAVHDLKQLPLTLRFFAGGINSIRGFSDSGIGPGKYLYVGSMEYQNHITGNWNAAVFYDFGTAANHWNAPVNKGAGVGIVYDTRVGPIKLYLAQAISKNSKPYSIEFSIGPEFP